MPDSSPRSAAPILVADAATETAAEKSMSPTAPAPFCIPSQWLLDNGEALVSSNVFVAQHGLPLGRYRNF